MREYKHEERGDEVCLHIFSVSFKSLLAQNYRCHVNMQGLMEESHAFEKGHHKSLGLRSRKAGHSSMYWIPGILLKLLRFHTHRKTSLDKNQVHLCLHVLCLFVSLVCHTLRSL